MDPRRRALLSPVDHEVQCRIERPICTSLRDSEEAREGLERDYCGKIWVSLGCNWVAQGGAEAESGPKDV